MLEQISKGEGRVTLEAHNQYLMQPHLILSRDNTAFFPVISNYYMYSYAITNDDHSTYDYLYHHDF